MCRPVQLGPSATFARILVAAAAAGQGITALLEQPAQQITRALQASTLIQVLAIGTSAALAMQGSIQALGHLCAGTALLENIVIIRHLFA